jgi:hypothetical protein
VRTCGTFCATVGAHHSRDSQTERDPFRPTQTGNNGGKEQGAKVETLS